MDNRQDTRQVILSDTIELQLVSSKTTRDCNELNILCLDSCRGIDLDHIAKSRVHEVRREVRKKCIDPADQKSTEFSSPVPCGAKRNQ